MLETAKDAVHSPEQAVALHSTQAVQIQACKDTPPWIMTIVTTQPPIKNCIKDEPLS